MRRTGLIPTRLSLTLLIACNITPLAADTVSVLDTVVVTSARESQEKRDLAESVSVASQQDIETVQPGHPAELTNRMAGVHVNNLGGEGHMTAIRQPITTQGVYLFLEDGIPTRPTGVFNHNGLYEINIPQAAGVEITKGPGSALYGSDSIGGVINVLTHPAPWEPEANLTLETGSFGWQRALLDGGSRLNENHALRISANRTDNEGYRDESDYLRKSATLRLDSVLSESSSAKSVFSYTHVDQSGVSGLPEVDYLNDPEKNLYHGDMGLRDVQAIRLSSEASIEPDANHLISVTPFLRDNRMTLMPSWMLTYDPNIQTTRFQSVGLLAKHRIRLDDRRSELVYGVDIDYTPMQYREKRITPLRNGDIYTDYTLTGRTNYDFDADQLSVSPYVQASTHVTDVLQLSAGLRYDYFHVDYRDNLDTATLESQPNPGGFTHLRPDSDSLHYDHVSPKLGAIYDINKAQQVFANYRHSFRVPTVGQLFRSGSSVNSIELEPVKADSIEIGNRGAYGRIGYEAAVYHMRVRDDVVTYIDGADRKVTNAGETAHQGIELSTDIEVSSELSMHAAWTWTDQKYNDYQYAFSCFPPSCMPAVVETRNYDGFKIGKAPESFGNISLRYQPDRLARLTAELEWEYLGDYYTDETNTRSYRGHDLFNLRAEYRINDNVTVYGRGMNLSDETYSTYTSNQVGNPNIEYRPGTPRAWYVGVRLAL